MDRLGADAAVVDACLVVGGRYHDFDFARLKLLELLAEDDRIRTKVGNDYRDLASLAASRFLVTYTCDVRPSVAEQEALIEFVRTGGRWLALHGTNAVLERTDAGMDTPPLLGEVATVLGSRFLSHPPIVPYWVDVVAPEHPLVNGIEPFTTEGDELYLCEFYDSEMHTVLLSTDWTGDTEKHRFPHHDWSEDIPRPVMYLRPYGAGEVLYITLGHCRGHFDHRPDKPFWPNIQRGSWVLPEFTELLRRGIRWARGDLPGGSWVPPKTQSAAFE